MTAIVILIVFCVCAALLKVTEALLGPPNPQKHLVRTLQSLRTDFICGDIDEAEFYAQCRDIGLSSLEASEELDELKESGID